MKTKKTSKVTHVHYVVVVLSVLVLGILVTVVILPLRNSGVLSAHVIAQGPIDQGQNDNPLVHTTHEVNPNENSEDGSGRTHPGPGGPFHTMGNRFGGLNNRPDHRASDSADEDGSDDNGDGIVVASESGERVHLKKDPKEKILVLPQKAVDALLKNGIIQAIASPSGSASSGAYVIYTRTNGNPVYIVAGTKEEKLFGAFPVNVNKTVTVSAETGQVVSTKESLVNRILDLFSF